MNEQTLSGPKVAVLAYDGLCTFEFGIACELFGLARPEMGKDWYRFVVAGVEAGPFRAHGGLSVMPDHSLDALADADLIIVPGWRGIDAEVPGHLIEAVKKAHARGARIASLCSGIVVLAAAGLLDGQAATTHWRYAEQVADRFPSIHLRPDVLYVDNGAVLTAAGSSAGIDLCLHIIRQDYGREAANSVARRLVMAPHREGGQAQFIKTPMVDGRTGKAFAWVLDQVRSTLSSDHSVSSMAKLAGMSLRTFQRSFHSATGLSPADWLITERMQACQHLLETSDLGADDICLAVGFGTPETMRHHFRKRLGISPARYRERFGRAPENERQTLVEEA